MRIKKYEVLDHDDGRSVRYRRHENGGGLVATGATVDERAYLAQSVWVDPGAVIGAGAHIGSGGWIEPGARIDAGVRIASNVRVGPGAHVGARARIGSRSRIGAQAKVAPGVTLEPDSDLADGRVADGRSRSTAGPGSPRYGTAA
jgi:UDP-3-O-[3-hydroxymyristoyl] glucosamine N-acyltransferase